jgi:hypothetical protein
VEQLEKQLNELQLDKSWNSTVSKFVVQVGHMVMDHQNVVDRRQYNDTFYIQKFNATLSLHPEMSSYITTFETQRQLLQWLADASGLLTSSGRAIVVPDPMYKLHYQNMYNQALVIDQRQKSKTPRVQRPLRMERKANVMAAITTAAATMVWERVTVITSPTKYIRRCS